MKTRINKKGAMALSQIMILLIGIIAISYAIGGGVGVVSGSAEGTHCLSSAGWNIRPTGDPYVYKCTNSGYYKSCNLNTGDDSGGPWSISDSESGHQVRIDCAAEVTGNKEPQETPKKANQDSGIGLQVPDPSQLVLDIGIGKSFEHMFNKVFPGLVFDKSKDEIIKDTGVGFFKHGAGEIIAYAGHALVIYGITKWALSGTKLTKAQADAISKGVSGGYFVGWLLTKGPLAKLASSLGIIGPWGWVVGFGLGALYTLISWKDESYKVVTYQCYAWDAELKGENCEECNNQGILPCTEYQCRSLGQGCELVNKGEKNEMCVYVDKGVDPAIIKPWIRVLTEGYTYDPITAITPPDRGVKIIPMGSKECVPAFTPFSFGVTLENDDGEPKMARCKWSKTREKSFADMPETFFTGGIKNYSHSITLSIPSAESLEAENITIEHGEINNIYVRCEDVNGNTNLGNFIFQFCVDDEPDMTAPKIVETDWIPSEGGPIAFGTSSANVTVYINEPSDCKWSHTEQAYETMENEMSCDNSIMEINSQLLYACVAKLDGLKDRIENKFYFKCKDKPWEVEESLRYANEESFPFTLIGTQPLIINTVSPNNTIIKDSTELVKVTFEVGTSAGYDEGKSSCLWSETGNDNDYIMFFGDEGMDQWQHSQELWFVEGTYKYYIKCVDVGGNVDRAQINFTIETDREPPIIVRAFHEKNDLKIITSEKAECVYSLDDCKYEFKDGLEIMTNDKIEHSITWNPENVYHIKCQDEYGNQPAPDECSIIARPSDF